MSDLSEWHNTTNSPETDGIMGSWIDGVCHIRCKINGVWFGGGPNKQGSASPSSHQLSRATQWGMGLQDLLPWYYPSTILFYKLSLLLLLRGTYYIIYMMKETFEGQVNFSNCQEHWKPIKYLFQGSFSLPQMLVILWMRWQNIISQRFSHGVSLCWLILLAWITDKVTMKRYVNI